MGPFGRCLLASTILPEFIGRMCSAFAKTDDGCHIEHWIPLTQPFHATTQYDPNDTFTLSVAPLGSSAAWQYFALSPTISIGGFVGLPPPSLFSTTLQPANLEKTTLSSDIDKGDLLMIKRLTYPFRWWSLRLTRAPTSPKKIRN